MAFNFDSFAGAVWTLSEAIDETAILVGIPREALTRALSHHAKIRQDRWEERLWRAASSKESLGEWIYKRARNFNMDDESEILQIAKTIPYRIRKNLIEIAKSIPASPGGKRPALDPMESWRVRSEVRKLREKGMSKEKAYEVVAKGTNRSGHKVSAHTVRRICDPKERERSRHASRQAGKQTNAAFMELDTGK